MTGPHYNNGNNRINKHTLVLPIISLSKALPGTNRSYRI